MSRSQVSIDTERCIGAAQCVLTAPALFIQNDDGVSGLVHRDGRGLSDTDSADARAAELVCPVRAITVSEAHT